jgi:hypothetical protein
MPTGVRHALLVLLLALCAAADGPAPVGDGKTFELPVPAGDEWLPEKPDRDAKALLKTEFADSDPKAVAEVRVMVHPLSKALAEKTLEALANDWAAAIESNFPDPTKVEEGASELGGEEAWFRDVRTDWARLTWHVARKNEVIFVFHVIRTNKAVDDEDLEKQVALMRASFRYLAPPAKPGEARPPEPPRTEDEKLPRETLTFEHWRLECVKPEGLRNVPPAEFDAAETASGVKAKFERTDGQTRIMVRIYAQSAAAQKFTIEQLAGQKLKRFEEAYDEAHRSPPARDDAWKPPLAERAIRLVLTGRARTVQVTEWHLAQCKNDRQYQVEIYIAGDAERWSKEKKEILDGFRPVKG